MARIIISGGSGFIGTQLCAYLKETGDTPVVFDVIRPKIEVEFRQLNLLTDTLSPELFEHADAIVHLAGANIASRWTSVYKKLIYESRVRSARNMLAALAKTKNRPRVFVSASAIGYYGDRGDEVLTEASAPGKGFLADVCRDWEAEARRAKALGMQITIVRTAPVLGRGGILAKMLPVFKLGIGGPLGLKKRWFAWIHLEDLVRVYTAAVRGGLAETVNAASPQETTSYAFARAMGRALGRPALLPVPELLLKLVMGEGAEAALQSARIRPEALLRSGCTFLYPDLETALKNALSAFAGKLQMSK